MSPVAVMTGAGRGQGASETTLLRSHGWEVVATDVAGEVDVVAEVCDAEAWTAFVETVLERHGRLDGLVKNAAVHHTRPLLQELPEDVERVFRINTLAPLIGVGTSFHLSGRNSWRRPAKCSSRRARPV
jgi:3alpha(or 20beta)-hydroxysteroid dehydrogenase